MNKNVSTEAVARSLQIRDLTDPAQGPHAIQLLIRDLVSALLRRWSCALQQQRASPIVAIADNYDALGYAGDAVARDARYTRYVDGDHVLRTQTSAMIPPALRQLTAPADMLLACPGIVYRRDCIDRLHTGEPHQLDLWRISSSTTLSHSELRAMVDVVVTTALPGCSYRVEPAAHPYTIDGLQIDVSDGDLLDGEAWVEIGECGLADPGLLRRTGHEPAVVTGLAMGLGLDRLLMLRKGIDDIRLLRSADPRIAEQMLDLSAYRPVSRMPPLRRDLSIAVDGRLDGELLGDRVREAMADAVNCVESVEVLSETSYEALPEAARRRLGIVPGQKNMLLRVVMRHLSRSLTHDEGNALRDRIYATLHEGTVQTWAKEN